MRFAIRPFGLAALAAGVLTLALSSDASAQRKLSFAYDQPVTTAYGLAANIFDEKLKALSGGKLSINQFPGAQLGTEPQTLQKLRAGDIDFVITATAPAMTAMAASFPIIVFMVSLPDPDCSPSAGCLAQLTCLISTVTSRGVTAKLK